MGLVLKLSDSSPLLCWLFDVVVAVAVLDVFWLTLAFPTTTDGSPNLAGAPQDLVGLRGGSFFVDLFFWVESFFDLGGMSECKKTKVLGVNVHYMYYALVIVFFVVPFQTVDFGLRHVVTERFRLSPAIL